MDHPLELKDHFYKLGEDGKTPVGCTPEEWRQEILTGRHHIAFWTDGANQASVVFLGLAIGTHTPRRLFELKIDELFTSHSDIRRFATYDETLTAWRAAIEKCREPDGLPTEEAWIADPITRARVPFE